MPKPLPPAGRSQEDLLAELVDQLARRSVEEKPLADVSTREQILAVLRVAKDPVALVDIAIVLGKAVPGRFYYRRSLRDGMNDLMTTGRAACVDSEMRPSAYGRQRVPLYTIKA